MVLSCAFAAFVFGAFLGFLVGFATSSLLDPSFCISRATSALTAAWQCPVSTATLQNVAYFGPRHLLSFLMSSALTAGGALAPLADAIAPLALVN